MENYHSADREWKIISTLRVKARSRRSGRNERPRGNQRRKQGREEKEKNQTRCSCLAPCLERICIRTGPRICNVGARLTHTGSARHGDIQRVAMGPLSPTCVDQALVMQTSQRRIETSGSPESRLHTDRQRTRGGHACARLSAGQPPLPLPRRTRGPISQVKR